MSGYSGDDMEGTVIDYSAYDLMDEFTVGEIGVACTLREDGACDGYKAGVIQRAIGQAIVKGQLSSSLSDEYLSADGAGQEIDWDTRWALSIKIQRSDLTKWFESKGQHPPFLFKETRASENKRRTEAPITELERQNISYQYNSPEHLTVVVDEINELVFVETKGSSKPKRYKRHDIVGKGTATWLLFVDFAKCNGSVEDNTQPDVKKRNTPGNRKNLGDRLTKLLKLDKPPIIEGRNGVMRFASISLASDS